MPLDTDGKIRMGCSSQHAMATLETTMRPASGDDAVPYDVATGNDADADRHGIVTPDAGLLNANHYLAVAIHYLLEQRPNWPREAASGKTLVSSALIDKVGAAAGREEEEVTVGLR